MYMANICLLNQIDISMLQLSSHMQFFFSRHLMNACYGPDSVFFAKSKKIKNIIFVFKKFRLDKNRNMYEMIIAKMEVSTGGYGITEEEPITELVIILQAMT